MKYLQTKRKLLYIIVLRRCIKWFNLLYIIYVPIYSTLEPYTNKKLFFNIKFKNEYRFWDTAK